MFGLRVKPTYEQLIGEITKPLFNSYPDRKASQLRFSNWLSQLDAEGIKTLEQQQLQAMKEQQKQNLLREYSMSHGISRAEADAMSSATSDIFMDAQSRPDSDFRRRYGMPNNEEDQFTAEPQYYQMHGQAKKHIITRQSNTTRDLSTTSNTGSQHPTTNNGPSDSVSSYSYTARRPTTYSTRDTINVQS